MGNVDPLSIIHGPHKNPDQNLAAGHKRLVCREKALYNYFIPCHRRYSNQHNHCGARAAHDGTVECDTVDYITAFLYSNWLYFICHGINETNHTNRSFLYCDWFKQTLIFHQFTCKVFYRTVLLSFSLL